MTDEPITEKDLFKAEISSLLANALSGRDLSFVFKDKVPGASRVNWGAIERALFVLVDKRWPKTKTLIEETNAPAQD